MQLNVKNIADGADMIINGYVMETLRWKTGTIKRT